MHFFFWNFSRSKQLSSMVMVSNCDDFIFLIYERIVIYEISLTLLNVLTATYICYINSFYFSTNEMVFKANINILLSKIFYWDLKVKAWSLKKTSQWLLNFFKKQILVTVPQCLEILLLSPHKQEWVKRMRYVIFDEVRKLSLPLSQLNSFLYMKYIIYVF